MNKKKEHWEIVYGKKDDHQVSWYQDVPETSLRLISELQLSLESSIIDIGGGNSNFTIELQKIGYKNLSVLDISGLALMRTKKKMGDAANAVNWVESDVLDLDELNKYDVIHDRATFHFLTNEDEIKKYVDIVSGAIIKGGHLVISTFSLTGPEKCSNLQVSQYSSSTLANLFNENFKMISSFNEVHTSPYDTSQDFIFCVFTKL
ncbi:MAG: class I SAM-dependent methyltransferase [Flavobacteriales bacterium]|jgi:ubiquinone/menaquinone biosynthesis C-methylase UbiE|nr:class I SAM-dependent methyltransferase [Flavobacteriales bacterium]MBT6174736.1 class I SAM-dependent methyltransferase [Flavobacteriales bacterium]